MSAASLAPWHDGLRPSKMQKVDSPVRLVCLLHFFWLCSIWVLSKISRVFGGGHTEAQTKSPGRVSSKTPLRRALPLPLQTARIAQVHGTLAFAVLKFPWMGCGLDQEGTTGRPRRQGRNRHTGSWEGWKMREEEVVTGAGLIIQREGAKR